MGTKMDLALVLWALLAFQLKHFLCDFVLQTKYQVDTKKIYGNPGGFIHSGLHTLMTLPIVYVASGSALTTLIIGVIEFIVHYHVDWTKGNADTWGGWTEKDQAYWVVFGADQLVHQLTYLAIVAYLAGAL
jgi:hypothetical protein